MPSLTTTTPPYAEDVEMPIHSEQKDRRVSDWEDEDARWDSCFLWGYITGVAFATITYCLVVGFMHLFE